MSKRRKPGDWVRLKKNAGYTGESDRLLAQIQDQGDSPCFHINGCDDSDCKEWNTLWTEPDPQSNNERHMLCHVSECEMLDPHDE